ncbi:glutathione S-transferase A-like isoform X2 [Antennarius striatus]
MLNSGHADDTHSESAESSIRSPSPASSGRETPALLSPRSGAPSTSGHGELSGSGPERGTTSRKRKTKMDSTFDFFAKKMDEMLERDNHLLLEMQTAQHKHDMAMIKYLGEVIKEGQSQRCPPVPLTHYPYFPPGASQQNSSLHQPPPAPSQVLLTPGETDHSETMATDITLMCATGCAPCWMVELALKEKQKNFTHTILSYEKGDHRSQQVLDVNPRGALPAFKHGDNIVNEALAICLYLESAFKNSGNQLIPDSFADQATMYQRFQEADILRQKIGDVLFYELRTPAEERTEYAEKNLSSILTAEVQLWEMYMQKRTGPYLAGGSFTLADVCAFPCIAALIQYGLSQQKYPWIADYYKTHKGRATIVKSWPSIWPKAPKGYEALKNI